VRGDEEEFLKHSLFSQFAPVHVVFGFQFILLTCASLLVDAADVGARGEVRWPQFRGAGGSGVAAGSDLPIHFGAESNVGN
jgi:hypothetical protein